MITAAQCALRLLGILSDCVVDISFVSVALLSFKSRGWMNALFVEHLMPYAMLMRTTSTVIWWNIFKNGSLERWKRKSGKTSRTVQLSNVMKSKFVARTDGLVSGQDIILKMNLSENASFRDSHLHFKSVVFHFFTITTTKPFESLCHYVSNWFEIISVSIYFTTMYEIFWVTIVDEFLLTVFWGLRGHKYVCLCEVFCDTETPLKSCRRSLLVHVTDVKARRRSVACYNF